MIENNKIPVLVVLFCPEKVIVSRLIELQKLVNLFVYDNSPKLLYDDLTSLLNYYSLDTSNSGISGAMRWMVQQCTTNKLTNFIFLDQDTIISENAIHQICEVLKSQDQHINIIHFTSEIKSIPPRFVINSGTLLNVNFLLKHFRILETYFVDGIDLALSAASRRDGQQLNLHIISGIDHVSGQGFELWQVGPLKLKVKQYPAVRRPEFYRSHRILALELISHFQFFDAMIVFKFAFAFWLGQFKYDLSKHLGRKL